LFLFEQSALHCKKPSFVNEEVFSVNCFADSQSHQISKKSRWNRTGLYHKNTSKVDLAALPNGNLRPPSEKANSDPQIAARAVPIPKPPTQISTAPPPTPSTQPMAESSNTNATVSGLKVILNLLSPFDLPWD
jgi:hypothetical protein